MIPRDCPAILLSQQVSQLSCWLAAELVEKWGRGLNAFCFLGHLLVLFCPSVRGCLLATTGAGQLGLQASRGQTGVCVAAGNTTGQDQEAG